MSASQQACIILGGGGHARVLLEALPDTLVPLGLTDPDEALWGGDVAGVPVLGGDEAILRYSSAEVLLVNGLGSTFSTAPRRALFKRWREKGYTFASIVHPQAILSPSARLAPGVQVLAGSVVNTGADVGTNSIINTGSIVEHDCKVGQHAHIAPGVVLSGGVRVGHGCHLGTGSVVIQNVEIGDGCVIGAGAVVTTSLEPYILALGVPARAVRSLAP